MKTATEALAGLSILIVEDEVMVAMMLEDMLLDLGCKVASAGSIEEALSAIRREAPDGVLLDMNMHGSGTVPVAEELAGRAVPFLLVTGYGATEGDPPVIKGAPRVQKPFSEEQLGLRMAETFVAARRGRTAARSS